MDFGIGAAQILLLKAALSPDKADAAASLDEWWKGIADFDDVRGTDSALFPQIYWNLGSRINDPTLRARLKGAARHHWVKNQYLIASAGEILDHLERAEVPVLLLKGAAIASTVDADPGLRAMSDCDMLIPRARAVEVVNILLASNLLDRLALNERDLNVIHGVTVQLRNNNRALFDIHWRPLRTIGADELAAEMFAAARKAVFAGRACLAPGPEHLLFHAIVHGTEWSPYPRYDWLVDSVKILRRAKQGFDWNKLIDLARHYHFGHLVRVALIEARAKAGIAVPRFVLKQLFNPLSVLERAEGRLRLSKPSSLSAPAEMLLALQTIRRRSGAALKKPALGSLPILVKSLLGGIASDRSFIDNDRKEPITLLMGWSAPEAGGRWTEGRIASFALLDTGARPTTLSLRGTLLPTRGRSNQIVDVRSGLRRLGVLRGLGAPENPYVQAVFLPSSIWRGNTAVIRFHIQDPASPIDLGINGDTRALGLFVESIVIATPERDIIDSPLDLSSGGSDIDVLWHGWSKPETIGCWSVGPLAVMRWRAARDVAPDTALRIDIAMVAPGGDSIRGRVFVNNRKRQSFGYPGGKDGIVMRLAVPTGISAGEEVEIKFKIKNPRSPASTIGTADERTLGLCLRRIAIDEPGSAS